MSLDQRLLFALSRHRPAALTRLLRGFTYSGTSRAWLAAAALLQLLHWANLSPVPRSASFLRALLAPLAAWGASTVLKRWIGRPRPSASALVELPACGSFPSGHAAAAFAFFFALCLAGHPFAPWVGSWAVVVAFSRVYLGVHYPSDVAGGIALGFVSAWLLGRL